MFQADSYLRNFMGVILIIVGIISLFIGIMLSRKLSKMRLEMQEKIGTDFERIQEQFNRFDTNRTGFIDSQQFCAMCAALGLDLTNTERDYALNLLDKDRDGVIDVYEFSAWFNSRSKEFV